MTIESATNCTAVGAVLSPFWLPSLQTVSDACAVALPILGVAWLVFQITAKVYDLKKG